MQTPRRIVKSLLRDQRPPYPLLIPLVFTLAAKVAHVAVPVFLASPTKQANALSAVHRHLHTDGVVASFDLTLVAEALGCTLNWRTVPPAIVGRPPRDVPITSLLSHGIERQGRIPTALDVVRRLQVMLRDEPALLVAMAGPAWLGQQLIGEEFVQRLAAHEDRALAMLDDLAAVLLDLAQAFCRAGADILLLIEPAISPAMADRWRAALTAVWNVVRFHEALPVLLYADGLAPPIALDGAPLVCLTPEVLRSSAASCERFGLVLPANMALPADVGQWTGSERCVLVLTVDEVPYHTDIQNLDRMVAMMRSALEHHSRRTA